MNSLQDETNFEIIPLYLPPVHFPWSGKTYIVFLVAIHQSESLFVNYCDWKDKPFFEWTQLVMPPVVNIWQGTW